MVALGAIVRQHVMATRLQMAWLKRARGRLRDRGGALARSPSPAKRQLEDRGSNPVSHKHREKWNAAMGSAKLLMQLSDSKVHVAQKAIEKASSVTEVKSHAELKSLPYWAQGDAALYTDSALKARFKLRTHPLVVAELERWWATAVRSIKGRGSEQGALSRPFDLDPECVELEKRDYLKVLRRLYKALLGEALDKQAADEDWRNDARGGRTMSSQLFMDALFELADVWTAGVSPVEYRDFLAKLFVKVTDGSPPDSFFWKSQNRVEAPEQSEPSEPPAVEPPPPPPPKPKAKPPPPPPPKTKKPPPPPAPLPRRASKQFSAVSRPKKQPLPDRLGMAGRVLPSALSALRKPPSLHSVGKFSTQLDPEWLTPWQLHTLERFDPKSLLTLRVGRRRDPHALTRPMTADCAPTSTATDLRSLTPITPSSCRGSTPGSEPGAGSTPLRVSVSAPCLSLGSALDGMRPATSPPKRHHDRDARPSARTPGTPLAPRSSWQAPQELSFAQALAMKVQGLDGSSLQLVSLIRRQDYGARALSASRGGYHPPLT